MYFRSNVNLKSVLPLLLVSPLAWEPHSHHWEPLSTIVVSKMGEDFGYLMGLIGPEVIPTVIVLGLISMFFVQSKESSDTLGSKQPAESYKEIIIRAAKIYLFVMALTFLGHGFVPLLRNMSSVLVLNSCIGST